MGNFSNCENCSIVGFAWGEILDKVISHVGIRCKDGNRHDKSIW